MDTLVVIEHQTVPIADTTECPSGSFSSRQAKELEKLSGALPKGFMTWGRDSVKFSSYCGVLQLTDLTIEVLPKIYGKEDQPGSCRLALIRMLSKAKLLTLPKGTSANLSLQRYALLDVFILLFCEQLKIQVLQGLVRQYESTEENIPVLRGRLLINEQLKNNLAHKERLFCRYDELTADIKINQIIKFTLNLLYRFCTFNQTKKVVTEALFAFEEVSDQYIVLHDFKGIAFDRSTARYEGLINQCDMFIRGLAPDVVAGESSAISLLFDMNRLFEAWVAAKLKPEAFKKGLTLKEQGPRKYLAVRADTAQAVFQMRPDISLIDDDGAVVEIIDAKWKVLDSSESKLGVSQSDLYQMVTYDSNYAPDRLTLIYPKFTSVEDTYHLKLPATGSGELCIRLIRIES